MTMHALQKTKQPLSFFTESVIDFNAVNFWLQKFNPLWSSNQALAKVVHKEFAADDMVSLTLQVNRHFKFGEAGQHHPIFVTVNGVRYERTYSLTQLDHQHVLLSVKKVEAGKVSTWLTEQAKAGDILEFGIPFGDMTVPMDKPLVLLAAGSGNALASDVLPGEAADALTEAFSFNISQRWSVAHLYQAILNGEASVKEIDFLTTLAGYVHWRLSGERVLGIGDASGMFPVDEASGTYDAALAAKFDALPRVKAQPWRLLDILPRVLRAGACAGHLTAEGARLLDLSGQLGIAVSEARGLMEEYFERFGHVRDYLGEIVAQARRTGYTETLLGRRRYLPDLTSSNRQRREMAERMVELAGQQAGYLGAESTRDAQGFGITVSYWESEEAIRQWKHNAEHQIAQEKGHTTWYQHFELRIARVDRKSVV